MRFPTRTCFRQLETVRLRSIQPVAPQARAVSRKSLDRYSAVGSRTRPGTLFFFGPTWHIDQPPHRNGTQFEMILDGKIYRRVHEYREAPGKDRIAV